MGRCARRSPTSRCGPGGPRRTSSSCGSGPRTGSGSPTGRGRRTSSGTWWATTPRLARVMSQQPSPDVTARLPVTEPLTPGPHHVSQQATDPDPSPPPLVTIVLPCFNEQDHVIEEVERICAAMDASGLSYELLAIDDASTDATLPLLEEALPRFPHMRLMPFRRNGGSGPGRRIRPQDA